MPNFYHPILYSKILRLSDTVLLPSHGLTPGASSHSGGWHSAAWPRATGTGEQLGQTSPIC
jgi:hypothetical protein